MLIKDLKNQIKGWNIVGFFLPETKYICTFACHNYICKTFFSFYAYRPYFSIILMAVKPVKIIIYVVCFYIVYYFISWMLIFFSVEGNAWFHLLLFIIEGGKWSIFMILFSLQSSVNELVGLLHSQHIFCKDIPFGV